MVRIQSHDAHQLELLQFQAVRRNRVQIVGAQATRRRQAQLAQSAAILQQHLEALAGQQLLAQATHRIQVYKLNSPPVCRCSLTTSPCRSRPIARNWPTPPCRMRSDRASSTDRRRRAADNWCPVARPRRSCWCSNGVALRLVAIGNCVFLYVCKTKSYPNSNALAVDSA